MSIEALRDQLPDYAKDIRLNLGSLAADGPLNDQQKWGTFVASALASRHEGTIKAIVAEAEGKLSEEAMTAAKAAATIMGMNNVYYRFVHLVSEKTYSTMPANLRMTVIGKPGVDKIDFELWCLAVSAINGCGMCIDSHDAVVRKSGITTEQVQTAVRIASVVHAAAATLDGEAALS
ncbi:AhpD, alkyl hydroperoxide reductase D [Parvularcula bermudensis HTCC2503]|uniref:Alkyl hydroperoxide reductase AhpD n=1 Tax=Parvularcula bermudensis (strain ATCC BAA-594 / HTCC2503 / KCTC 12087) TaxID=314260 RepID=E0THM1_PARBH|nr:carboxymuconolactone decarboxylase family protein [Parvularcula bermudensis]ADM09317.1 AhpD, alkyl hydroperoxide reductase D [Parvularcula bermudensis HTCC2503]